MQQDLSYIEEKLNIKIYVTKEGCDLLNKAQSRIARERKVILDEREVLAPSSWIFLLSDETIDGFATRLENEYYICINKGVIEEQGTYLKKLDWSFISDELQRDKYISDMIEYGFYFFVFHEYAHIFCGHVDAGLSSPADIKAQECEADMFAMDYLIKYIVNFNLAKNYTIELEKLFLAIYFLFDNMKRDRWEEWYNDKLIQNYYLPEREEKRKHPLYAQRMLYLYEMLNIVIVMDKAQLLPIKEDIIEKLRILKRLTDKEIPHMENNYQIVEDSIKKLKESMKDIRKKIPRIEKFVDEE